MRVHLRGMQEGGHCSGPDEEGHAVDGLDPAGVVEAQADQVGREVREGVGLRVAQVPLEGAPKKWSLAMSMWDSTLWQATRLPLRRLLRALQRSLWELGRRLVASLSMPRQT